jgi:hypothetical protein
MRIAISVFFLLCFQITSAQEYGIQWVLGYNESVLDFRNDTLKNYPIGPLMPMVLTNASICDSSGDLLYYTNGIYIAGKNGVALADGDSLSPCDYSNQLRCCGLNIPQATLFLPKPGDTSRFYLIHFSNDTDNGNLPGNLYFTEIHDSGSGIIERKNVVFGKGIFRQGGVTACKHANGRDWWVVMGLHNSNEYFTYLFTPDSIIGPIVQGIGPIYYGPFDLPYSKFSQDGSKYVTSCYSGPILVMDFDRCTGEFNNPVVMYNQDSGAIVEFSPNGRFIYATNAINLAQFDLTLPDPQHDSITLYQADSNDVAEMRMLQLAPNGKLYASCFNGGYYFIHAVNYPDLKGDSAGYVDTAFTTLTAASNNFPNMVNYNLGPLYGSPCDTIYTSTATISKEDIPLRVMPNPVDKYVYVEMGMQGNYEFELFNETGQLILTKETRQVDIFDTERLASGVYFLKAIDKNNSNIVAVKKVVIQH